MVEVQTFTKCARHCRQMPIFRLTLVFMICLLFVTTEISDLHSLKMLLASPVIYNCSWPSRSPLVKELREKWKTLWKWKGNKCVYIYIRAHTTFFYRIAGSLLSNQNRKNAIRKLILRALKCNQKAHSQSSNPPKNLLPSQKGFRPQGLKIVYGTPQSFLPSQE